MFYQSLGKSPSADRLKRIKQSANYRDGKFQNQSHTPNFAEGYTVWKVMNDYFFKKSKHTVPTQPLPSVMTKLDSLREDSIVWFGHSSYFLQINGLKFLIDPVLSGQASPIPGSVKAFPGADVYKPEAIPEIDYLILTHDHYDHLDHKTMLALKARIKNVICGLGVGSHLTYWGFSEETITELDWQESLSINPDITLTAQPARHFSGRLFSRNNTLWCSYMVQIGNYHLFLGGDSGYDSHYKAIKEKFGHVDLALLDNGQYNKAWRYIHHLPEDMMRAAEDLGVRNLMPVHSSKFMLSNHAWYEPLETASANVIGKGIRLLTPMIGEPVRFRDETQTFTQWWKGLI